MRSSTATLVFAALLVVGLSTRAVCTEPVGGAVRGAVTDESGGVLPGVTVVATSADGQVLGTAVTDEVGAYALGALPAGPVHVTFELEGFAADSVVLTIEPGADARIEQHLALAPLTETVMVFGQAPPAPPPPPPAVIPVAEHDRESICGPAKPDAVSESFGTIRAHDDAARQLYTKDDQLVIDRGTLGGLEIGENYVVRRHYRASGAGGAATGEHTSGLVQIVAADEHTSTAVVIYACDEMMRGDFLASFQPQPIRMPDPIGIPVFEDAARILFADAGQMLGVPRRLMVIDKGRDAGVRAGQRLTLFRSHRAGKARTRQAKAGKVDSGKGPAEARPYKNDEGERTPSIIGEAVVVAVRRDSATIRVERATDAIAFGDRAAPQRRATDSLPNQGIPDYK